jgi:vacuolar-type H+-ATPase catalytic subunit A/Vma1
LQQNAFDRVDRHCSPERLLAMLRIVLQYVDRGMAIVAARIPVYRVKQLPVRSEILRMRFAIPEGDSSGLEGLAERIDREMDDLARE